MVPQSMTLSDLWPGFQGHNIFWNRISEKTARLKDTVTIAQEETIPNIWIMEWYYVWWPDLHWPLHTSCGFVSINWASCWVIRPMDTLTNRHTDLIPLLSAVVELTKYQNAWCTNQYPSEAGRTTVAGSRLVKIRTGDSFFKPADEEAPENEEWFSYSTW